MSSQIDNYLEQVESRLRCPEPRKTEVIEELRGHLLDRAEAAKEDPEAMNLQAIQELGSPQWLAFKLSLANHWSITAHVLRQFWGVGLGMEVALVWMFSYLLLQRFPAGTGILDPASGKVVFFAGSIIGLIALILFSFAMSRILSSWSWAIFPAIFMFYNIYYFWGIMFIVIAFMSKKNACQKTHLLSWISVGMLCLLFMTIVTINCMPASGGLSLHNLSQGAVYITHVLIESETISWLTLLVFPWFFWLGARVINRQDKSNITPVAD